MPGNQVLELCGSCSFGVYQCYRCSNLVSHLEDTLYREMVYCGPDDTFEDIWILCRQCVGGGVGNVRDDPEDTDTEEDIEMCFEDTDTQILC